MSPLWVDMDESVHSISIMAGAFAVVIRGDERYTNKGPCPFERIIQTAARIPS
jgi:hypothetical protein